MDLRYTEAEKRLYDNLTCEENFIQYDAMMCPGRPCSTVCDHKRFLTHEEIAYINNTAFCVHCTVAPATVGLHCVHCFEAIMWGLFATALWDTPITEDMKK